MRGYTQRVLKQLKLLARVDGLLYLECFTWKTTQGNNTTKKKRDVYQYQVNLLFS